MHAVIRLLLLGRRPGEVRDGMAGGRRHATGWLALALVVGIVARVAAATQGHNYDVESYWVVSGHVHAGDNVYASTPRYNYGPAWFLVLGAVRAVAELFPDPFAALRFLVVGLLTLVDVAIAWMLLRRFGATPAWLFLLHPVAILITGYHSQFDNLAVGVGLAAVLLMERGERAGSRRPWAWWLAGLAMLGLSLVVKHLLVVLPLWLAQRERSLGRAALVLVVPPAILALSFVPYVADGWGGIVANVIEYRSAENAPLWTWWLPPIAQRHVSPLVLLGASLLLAGWLWRHRPHAELLLGYTVVVTAFAPGVFWQYLAIPAAATVVYRNAGYLAYVAIAALFLAASPVNVGIPGLAELLPGFLVRGETGDLPYGYLLGLLAIGLAITLWELWAVHRSGAGHR